MITNLVSIDLKKGERVYRLICQIDAPLGEIYDVLCEMRGVVIQKIQEAERASQSEAKAEESQDV